MLSGFLALSQSHSHDYTADKVAEHNWDFRLDISPVITFLFRAVIAIVLLADDEHLSIQTWAVARHKTHE